MDLHGKSAVITGGGNGIGRAIALGLAAKGVNVGIADIDGTAANAVAEEATALGVQAFGMAVNVMDEAQVTALADKAWAVFGSVHLLFNNAGVGQETKPLLKTTKADLDWVMGVNFGGVMNGIRVFGPRFVDSGEACRIINTGSEHSLGFAHAYAGIYTASKHAVLGLSEILRAELPDNVGVSVICPGLTDSSLWRSTERRPDEFGGSAAAREGGDAVMKRGLSSEEVAAKTIAGVEAGEFYIITHAHIADYAAARADEIADAAARMSPRYEGDEELRVENVLQFLRDLSV